MNKIVIAIFMDGYLNASKMIIKRDNQANSQ